MIPAMTAAAVGGAHRSNLRVTGLLVRMEPAEFLGLLTRTANGLVVHAEGGLFFRHHQYLTSYKGLAFTTRSRAALALPQGAEVLEADSIWPPA